MASHALTCTDENTDKISDWYNVYFQLALHQELSFLYILV